MSNEVPRSSRKIKPISEETRQRIFDLSLQGRLAAEIFRMLSVNYKSVGRILKPVPSNTTGAAWRPYKLSREMHRAAWSCMEPPCKLQILLNPNGDPLNEV